MAYFRSRDVLALMYNVVGKHHGSNKSNTKSPENVGGKAQIGEIFTSRFSQIFPSLQTPNVSAVPQTCEARDQRQQPIINLRSAVR